MNITSLVPRMSGYTFSTIFLTKNPHNKTEVVGKHFSLNAGLVFTASESLEE